MVVLMSRLPYARQDVGMASPFLGGATRGKAWTACGISFLLCLFFGPVGIGLLAAGWTASRLLEILYRKGFGGITGDLLGTANECVEISLLFACACAGERILPYLNWCWPW